ncbi:MAG: class IV adenylate cyclase [Solirubrobacterales bacterium]|jgi:adenylate cyclase class 2|nr:class IV adenylate cyclase [Solirubrobacterales bacterium]
MEASRRNVELKAVDPQPARTLGLALGLGASDQGLLLQRDTYFAAARGRLKLREEEPGGAHLVAYVRPDDDREVRVSEYRLAPVAEPRPLRDALEAALGVRVVVEKRRRLLLWQAVRIHLDEVDGLGTFLELEAVAPADSNLDPERARVARLREVLEISDDRLREGSYADALSGARE